MAGSSRSQHGTDYDISLILVDPQGNTIWDKYLGQADSMEFAYSLIETSDSNYLVSGRIGMYFPYLTVFDINGDLIRDMRYPEGDQCYGANSVGETADGNYYFIETGPASTLYIVNPLGEIITSITYDFAYCNAVIQTSDQGYMLAGQCEDQFGYYKNIMIRTGPEGDTLWTKILPFENWIGTPLCIRECRFNSGYILSSRLYISPGGIYPDEYYLSITRLDTAGNIVWSRDFDAYTYGIGNNVTQTSDGGFLLTGHKEGEPEATDAILIKLDSLGDYVLSTKEIEFEEFSQVLTYPVPAKDILYFRMAEDKMKIDEVCIFNSSGQELDVLPVLSGNEMKLDLAGFPPGIYFYRLTTRNNKIFNGKFLVAN